MNTYIVKGVYKSLVGEGARSGLKAAHLRLANCNLWSGRPGDREKGEGACSRWCDADFYKGEALSTAEVLVALDTCLPLRASEDRWCWINGGEPMLQVDDELVDALHAAGWRVAVETNGTIDAPVLEKVDHLVVSPKLGTETKVHRAHELQVTMPGALPPDPGWTEEALEALALGGQWGARYVVPQDPIDPATVTDSFLVNLGHKRDLAGVYKLHLAMCVTFVDRHPEWRFSLQQGKLAGIP